jgi:L-ascorbate metabolism protein UlaG (beta-lactamase superfamily)
MEITHLGHSSFRIKGKNTAIIFDPYFSEAVGLKFPKVEADIVTISHFHNDHNNVSGFPNAFIVDGPGEYKIKEVDILGIKTYHDENQGSERGKNTVFQIRLEGISLVHLGDLGHMLSDAQDEMLGVVDVLFVPVGGKYTIDSGKAGEVVAKLEPKIVIPMHYGAGGLSDSFKDLLPVENFLKVIGKSEITPQEKLVITKDKLPDEMQVVVLE